MKMPKMSVVQMTDCLFDSSVPLALIFDEPHTIDPDELLANAGISPVNLAEFAAIMRIKGIPDEQILPTIRDFGLTLIPFDEDVALAAAELIPIGRPFGIGLGDCACIATGLVHGLPIYTADRDWLKLKVDADIQLIR